MTLQIKGHFDAESLVPEIKLATEIRFKIEKKEVRETPTDDDIERFRKAMAEQEEMDKEIG